MSATAIDLELVRPTPCFVERDPHRSLVSRSAAEGVGTALLVTVVLCTGPTHPGPLAAAMAIAGALVGLILAFGPISGGHFNPLITLAQWALQRRDTRCAAAYVAAQLAGAAVGVVLARLLYPTASGFLPAANPNLVFAVSELVATSGLLAIVLFASSSGLGETGPFAVGAWLVGAIVVTPSGALANPALVFGAFLAGLPGPVSASGPVLYVGAEVLGAATALLCLKALGAARDPRREGTGASRSRGHLSEP